MCVRRVIIAPKAAFLPSKSAAGMLTNTVPEATSSRLWSMRAITLSVIRLLLLFCCDALFRLCGVVVAFLFMCLILRVFIRFSFCSQQQTGGNVSTRTGQQIAPPGHYAFNGILYVCPAGFYGATSGLSTATCSGPCSVPGYYCPGQCFFAFEMCDWR